MSERQSPADRPSARRNSSEPTPAVESYLRAPDLLPGAVGSTVGYRITDAPVGVHRGLPSPWLTFVISLDAPIETADSPAELGTPRASRTSIITGGLHAAPAWIHQPAAQTGIQLAVHPLAARAVFGAPTCELTQAVIDGRDVLGQDAERLRERLIETTDWSTRFDLLRDYLRRRTQDPPRQTVRAEVRAAWAWQARRHGTGSIAGMARHVLLSPRQLHAVFTREIGSGPKAVARLMRFQAAIRQVTAPVRLDAQRGSAPQPGAPLDTDTDADSQNVLDLARVAADCGYTDQSHLSREFRQFAGISPTGWLDEERRNIQAGGHRNGED